MTTKLFTLLLAVAASVETILAWDYGHVQIGDLYYNLDATNKTAEVTSQNSSYPYWSTTITTANIPASVTCNSVTYSVTSIGDWAFYDCTGLTSITIPNSVTSIGSTAFSGCSGLTSPVYNAHVFAYMPRTYSGAYTIPDGIESIAGSAFAGCKGLTSITIPNSVTSIGEVAFYNSGLTSPVYNAHVFAYMPTSYSGAYTIPDGIESIAGYAFSNCKGLTSVTIGNSVANIGNSAFFKCTGLTSITIGNSVTSIGDHAFYDCSGLTSPVYNAHIFAFMPRTYSGAYTIPDGIESIAGSAFAGCKGLTSITIPNSVTSIGEVAFYNSGLTSPVYNAHVFAYMPTSYSGAYTIPDGIESIAVYAFFCCSGLTSVTIPNSVTSIGNDAFRGCTGLTSVTISNSVTSIGGYAFRDCSGLTSVTIPNSVTSIGVAAFCDCTGLTSVTIGNSVTSIGVGAFSGCKGLTSVTIPNSVTSIGRYAFRGCTGLTSVTIPNSVTSIGDAAFSNCTGLTTITCAAMTPPVCGSGAFEEVPKSIPLYVPFGSLDAYRNATEWKDFIIKEMAKPEAIDQITNKQSQMSNKFFRNGQLFIQRGDKTYSITGQEVK